MKTMLTLLGILAAQATAFAAEKPATASQPELVAKAAALMKQARVDDPNWPMVEKATAKGKKANQKL